MKKIFAGIVLPTLAAVAVIGSGFSVWFFGENQDKVSSNGSIAVENLVRIGDLTTSVTSAELHLDQTKAVRSAILKSTDYVSANTNKNKDEKSNYSSASFGPDAEAKGLYLTTKDEGTAAGEFEIKYTPSTSDGYVDYIANVCKLEIKTTFTFSGGAEKYVGMDTSTSSDSWNSTTETNKVVYTYTWTTEAVANKAYSKTISYNDGETDNKADFKFVYLTIASSTAVSPLNTMEPHTDAEYSTMLDAVKNGKLTIETVATIVNARN